MHIIYSVLKLGDMSRSPMLGNHTISPVALRWKAPCGSHAHFPTSGAFVGSKVLAFAGIKGLSGFKDPSGCNGDPYPIKG